MTKNDTHKKAELINKWCNGITLTLSDNIIENELHGWIASTGLISFLEGKTWTTPPISMFSKPYKAPHIAILELWKCLQMRGVVKSTNGSFQIKSNGELCEFTLPPESEDIKEIKKKITEEWANTLKYTTTDISSLIKPSFKYNKYDMLDNNTIYDS